MARWQGTFLAKADGRMWILGRGGERTEIKDPDFFEELGASVPCRVGGEYIWEEPAEVWGVESTVGVIVQVFRAKLTIDERSYEIVIPT